VWVFSSVELADARLDPPLWFPRTQVKAFMSRVALNLLCVYS
jgi:hypothetical protein